MVDFAGLLDAPAYNLLGVDAVITPVGGPASDPIRVLDDTVEVEEEVAGGVHIPSTATAVRLRLADLAAQGLERADLEKAEVEIDGTLYAVLATRPAGNRRELELILIERK